MYQRASVVVSEEEFNMNVPRSLNNIIIKSQEIIATDGDEWKVNYEEMSVSRLVEIIKVWE